MHRYRHFDSLSDQVVLCGTLYFFQADTHANVHLIRLIKLIVHYIVYILEVPNPIPHLLHL